MTAKGLLTRVMNALGWWERWGIYFECPKCDEDNGWDSFHTTEVGAEIEMDRIDWPEAHTINKVWRRVRP